MKSIRKTDERMMLEGLPLKSPALNELAEQNSAKRRDRRRRGSVFLENSRIMGVSVSTTMSLLVVRVNIAANSVKRERPTMLGFRELIANFENLFAIYIKHFVKSADVQT